MPKKKKRHRRRVVCGISPPEPRQRGTVNLKQAELARITGATYRPYTAKGVQTRSRKLYHSTGAAPRISRRKHWSEAERDLFDILHRGNYRRFESLVRHVWVVAVDMTVARKLEVPRGSEIVLHHAMFAVQKTINRKMCYFCNGKKRLNYVVCDRCDGTGEIKLSDRWLAERLSMPRTTWRRLWKPLLDDLMGLLLSWDKTDKSA